MALRTRVWSAGKLLVLAGALAATYLVFAPRVDASRDENPRSAGAGPDEPERQRGDRAWRTAWASPCASTTCAAPTRRSPAGHVLAQEPPAGSLSRRQRSIRVWLSAGVHAGHRAGARRRNRARRATARGTGWPRAGRRGRDPIARLSAGRRRRPDAAGRKRPPSASRCSSIAASTGRAT